jgi:hypothetical protein
VKQKKYIWLSIAIVILLIGKVLMKFLMNITGQSKEEEIQIAQNTLNNKNYFDPNLWSNYFQESVFDKTIYENYSEVINGAIGYVYDDEDAIYGVLQNCTTGCSISYLAYIYWKKYNQSLLGKLQSNFTDDEMINVSNIVSRKPLK